MESRFGHDFAGGQTHPQPSTSDAAGLSIGGPDDRLQSNPEGDVHLAEACDGLIDKIRATPALIALNVDNRRLTEEITTEIGKRSRADQYHFLSKVKLLFDTRP